MGKSTATVPCRSVQCSTLRTPASSCGLQVVGKSDRPQPDHGMHLAGRSRQRDGSCARRYRSREPRYEIERQHRRIAGDGDDPARGRSIAGRPAHARQNARQRTDKARDGIGNDGKSEGGKALRIAVGVDGHAADLRRQPIDDMAQHGLAGQLEQPLVATAHAARLAAGQDDARDCQGVDAVVHAS